MQASLAQAVGDQVFTADYRSIFLPHGKQCIFVLKDS